MAGTQVIAFARDLIHLRWLYGLPNGDVLVAEFTVWYGGGWESVVRRQHRRGVGVSL